MGNDQSTQTLQPATPHVPRLPSAPIETQWSDAVWFHDGDLIIKAETTLFMVYRGIMSDRSAVFRGMFDLAAVTENLDGCPIVEVSDSADDTCYFLKSLNNIGFYDTESKVNFAVLSAVLRLSVKYDVEFYRQRAIHQLSEAFPSTLAGWDNKHTATGVPQIDGLAIAVVNLAHDVDARELLPSAMYLCATMQLDTLIDGVQAPDGQRFQLHRANLRTCVYARSKLKVAFRTRSLAFLRSRPYSSPCYSSDRCAKATAAAFRALEKTDWHNDCPDVLSPLEHNMEKEVLSAFCSNCQRGISRGYERARGEIWAELPTFFDLAGAEFINWGRRIR